MTHVKHCPLGHGDYLGQPCPGCDAIADAVADAYDKTLAELGRCPDFGFLREKEFRTDLYERITELKAAAIRARGRDT